MMASSPELSELEQGFMEAAFKEARAALTVGEVPVGCVFVRDDVIIARGHNTTNITFTPTRHAEVNCADQTLLRCYRKQLDPDQVFKDVHVYVTVEPCAMCADLLGQRGVKSVTYGCDCFRFGGCGSWADVNAVCGYGMNFRRGVRRDEAVDLLKQFYKGENPNAPKDKVKKKHSRS